MKLTLDDWSDLARECQGLTVVSTLRDDATIHSSLVNAGVTGHPSSSEPVLAFVTYGAVKLANLRDRPQLTATVRAGWQWASVEGRAEIVGRDGDASAEELRLLLREIFVAAGGSHDDWDAYDRTMLEEGRVAVLVRPTRVYGVRR